MCFRFLTFYALASPISSFSGLEEFGSDKSKCQDHFDVYKECKKKEVVVNLLTFRLCCFQLLCLPVFFFFPQREARLERNKTRSLFS